MSVSNGSDMGGGASQSTDPAWGTSSATDVSLREFLSERVDARFRYLHGEIDGHSKQDRLITMGIAMFGAFAWAQIGRHLTDLNHENARVAAVIDKTVSADTYVADEHRRIDERNKLDDWRSLVDDRLLKAATKEEVKADVRNEHRSTLDTSTRVFGAVAVAITIALSVLSYHVLTTSQKHPAVVTVTSTVEAPVAPTTTAP